MTQNVACLATDNISTSEQLQDALEKLQLWLGQWQLGASQSDLQIMYEVN